MRKDNLGYREPHERQEHRDNRDHEHEGLNKKHSKNAQTFRRGRALAFLERLNIKRSTLVQQLEQPEFESIKSVISGELKATDAIIEEFIHTFELREAYLENEQHSCKKE
ncbi:hypothetical protein [Paenibacillus sp. 79R4]|nr:hypothetical protein [Paenibacillus sp. 79R4]